MHTFSVFLHFFFHYMFRERRDFILKTDFRYHKHDYIFCISSFLYYIFIAREKEREIDRFRGEKLDSIGRSH